GSSQPLEHVSADELRGLEPALAPDLLGGMIASGEGRVRPEGLTAGVHRALIAQGVEVIEGIPVTRLTRHDREWLAETPTGPHRAQTVVIAGGVDSARLLAAHGLRLPIAAAKGYSRTYARGPSGPKQPLYLEAPKVAI